MSLFWISQISFWMSGVAFSYNLEKRENFYKRAGIFLTIIFLVTLFLRQIGTEVGYWSEVGIRIVLICLMCVFQYLCWKLSWTVAIYNALWSVAIWQLSTEIWSIIAHFRIEAILNEPILEPIGMTMAYGIIFFSIARTVAAWMVVDRKIHLGPRQMSSACLLFGIVELLGMSPKLRNITVNQGEWRFLIVCQLICMVTMYLQNEIFKSTALREELAVMNMLLKKEQEQYQMTKENIALINQKCHDMKHQIRALRNLDKEERDKYLDDLEEDILIYENMVKTGNEVLDTILTDKNLYCKARGIQVSCVADGNQMDFINVIDLYSLLGNALDNAIEAVEHLRNPDKRQIDVLIYKQKKFLVINIINPLEKKLIYDGENEVPVTTKGDKRYHGFGIRSMKYILGKYDGHLAINEEDGCFSLKILIPIPEKISE